MIKGPPPAYLDSHPLTFFINMGSKRLTSGGLYGILFAASEGKASDRK